MWTISEGATAGLIVQLVIDYSLRNGAPAQQAGAVQKKSRKNELAVVAVASISGLYVRVCVVGIEVHVCISERINIIHWPPRPPPRVARVGASSVTRAGFLPTRSGLSGYFVAISGFFL